MTTRCQPMSNQERRARLTLVIIADLIIIGSLAWAGMKWAGMV